MVVVRGVLRFIVVSLPATGLSLLLSGGSGLGLTCLCPRSKMSIRGTSVWTVGLPSSSLSFLHMFLCLLSENLLMLASVAERNLSCSFAVDLCVMVFILCLDDSASTCVVVATFVRWSTINQ